MIVNASDLQVAEKLRAESERSLVARTVYTAAGKSDDPFEVAAGATGLDLLARRPLESGLANRARLKVCSPRPGHTLVFFYKQSLVPYSRDRYSYGGIDLKARGVEEREVAEWLTFLSSGFHPEKRPANLRRAFAFEIPE
jgi:hypothetical protein